jgi:phosphate transport system substrate-binding protein
VIEVSETTPEDPQPFAQPLVYVYKKNPKPSVAAFLGFALASPGQKAIETARVVEAEAIAKGEPPALLTATNPTATPGATTSPVPGTAQFNSSPITETTPATTGFPNAGTIDNTLTQPTQVAPQEAPQLDRSLLWWLLLPVSAIAGLLLWFIKRPSKNIVASNPDPAPSEAETASEAASQPLVEIRNHTNSTTIQNTNSTVLQPTNTTAVAAQELENNPILQPNTTAVTAQESDKTNSGNYQVTIPPELEQSPWDMEAPAAVVNTSYPQMMELPKASTQVEDQTADVAPQIQETASVAENHQQLVEELAPTPADLHTQETELAPVASEESDIIDSLPDLPDFHTIFADTADEETTEQTTVQEVADETTQLTTADEEWQTPQVTASLPTFADIPEDALNLVADAAEIHETGILEDTEYLTPSSLGNLANGAVLAGVGAQAWVGNNDEETATSQVLTTTNPPQANLPTASAITAELDDEEEPSSIVFRPRNPEWAYVSWYVSPQDQQKLHNQGISELALRLYDVTDIDLSYEQPHQVEQYECEPGTSDRYVQIPASERDYIIDLGYFTGDNWVSITSSATVRVFNRPYIDPMLAYLPGLDAASSVVFSPRASKWAYVSWHISPAHQQSLQAHGITQLALRLYDATNFDLSYQHPQLVQQYEIDEITRDRYLSIPHSDRDYVTELGYVTTSGDWVTIARSATVRLFNHPQEDFWFVADTELIIHGATNPDATVTIAGKAIALKPDGTFHLRVPFSGDLLDYLITAASGEQTKTIHKKFTQETSES